MTELSITQVPSSIAFSSACLKVALVIRTSSEKKPFLVVIVYLEKQSTRFSQMKLSLTISPVLGIRLGSGPGFFVNFFQPTTKRSKDCRMTWQCPHYCATPESTDYHYWSELGLRFVLSQESKGRLNCESAIQQCSRFHLVICLLPQQQWTIRG